MQRKLIYEKYKKHHKEWVLFVYLALRILIVAAIIISILSQRWKGVLSCILALVLLLLPSVLERRMRLELPSVLETIILLMVFAAWVLGEAGDFYIHIPWWDTMLHTMNGFLCAAIGFALFDVLNQHPASKLQVNPAYLALMAFCFSMTVGVLWEIFEFGMDYFFRLDMQKDTVLTVISSVELDLSGKNEVITLADISTVAVNGRELGIGGYLDIGLYDTMEDLIVNFIGAVVCSFSGLIYVKKRKFNKFTHQFVPGVVSSDGKTEEDETKNNV